jgi:uncharacterized protein involved in exopolysaccharide biosynthesis
MTDERQVQESTRYGDEIDLRKLLRKIWDGRWLVGGIALAISVLAVIAAFMLPNIYRAEALLVPKVQERAGGLSSLTAQFGGLASLAGIDLGGGSVDETAIGLEVLKSRKFISEFIERHNILVPLIAAEGWNQNSDELKINSDFYDLSAKKWIRVVSPPKKSIPSSQEAYDVFKDLLTVSQDSETGFVTVAIEFYSPAIAKQWVDWLTADINAHMMEKDVAQAEQAIDYLNNQIANTSLADLRNVFYRMIEEQTKTVMLAKVSDEYLLMTLDPAVAPERKAKPRRALIVVLGLILGIGFGSSIVLMFRRNEP